MIITPAYHNIVFVIESEVPVQDRRSSDIRGPFKFRSLDRNGYGGNELTGDHSKLSLASLTSRKHSRTMILGTPTSYNHS